MIYPEGEELCYLAGGPSYKPEAASLRGGERLQTGKKEEAADGAYPQDGQEEATQAVREPCHKGVACFAEKPAKVH